MTDTPSLTARSLLARTTQTETAASKATAVESSEINPLLATRLRTHTAARIALRRSGTSLATGEILDFQIAHGRARDAVHASFQPSSMLSDLESLTARRPLLLHSAAQNRTEYLQRPDRGRRLSDESRKLIAAFRGSSDQPYDLAIVIADGLSAQAIERHAIPLLADLLPQLNAITPEVRMAPVAFVEQGRVAIADEVASLLSTKLAVILIGERPGLSSPDSLGAYITWNPRPGQTTDADRNCISNIRPEGLDYAGASSRLLYYIRESTRLGLTGTALKDPDPLSSRLGTGVRS